MSRDNTYVVIRKNTSDFSYGEPIYAGSNREFALSLQNNVFVVFEFDYNGKYVRTHTNENQEL